jgi:hypothetical protein
VELRLPATRLRSTPMALVLACAAAIVAVVAWLAIGGRASRAPAVEAPFVEASAAPPEAARDAAPPEAAAARVAAEPALEAAGPWAGVPPELAAAVQSRLAVYSRALETADPTLLGVARPDLSPDQRDRVLGPFRGAVNPTTDLRVLRVELRGDVADVVIRRIDVLGTSPAAPAEERLRFRRSGGEWALR